MPTRRSKWVVPGLFVAGGLVTAGAQLIAGRVEEAVFDIVLFCAVAAAIAFGGRSETIRGLRGDGSDERFRRPLGDDPRTAR